MHFIIFEVYFSINEYINIRKRDSDILIKIFYMFDIPLS